MYTIYCRVNYLTAIMLAPNEQIISVSGGDTARWQNLKVQQDQVRVQDK